MILLRRIFSLEATTKAEYGWLPVCGNGLNELAPKRRNVYHRAGLRGLEEYRLYLLDDSAVIGDTIFSSYLLTGVEHFNVRLGSVSIGVW
jgi:hypothetical protein